MLMNFRQCRFMKSISKIRRNNLKDNLRSFSISMTQKKEMNKFVLRRSFIQLYYIRIINGNFGQSGKWHSETRMTKPASNPYHSKWYQIKNLYVLPRSFYENINNPTFDSKSLKMIIKLWFQIKINHR